MRKKNSVEKIRSVYDGSGQLTVEKQEYAKFVGEFLSFLLKADEGAGDVTSNSVLSSDDEITAYIYAQESGVLAGIEELRFWLDDLKRTLKVEFLCEDGMGVKSGDAIVKFVGPAVQVMILERTVLNFLQRMSGIATYTRSMVDELDGGFCLACTRKTLWGVLDKKAVSVGGGLTHRLNLDDAVLVKDTHLKIINYDLKKLVSGLKKNQSSVRFVEVEVEEPKLAFGLVEELLGQGWKSDLVVMLDNFSLGDVKGFLANFDELYADLPFDVLFEASGGIDKEKICRYVDSGVDVVSMGSITMSAPALSFHLKVA